MSTVCRASCLAIAVVGFAASVACAQAPIGQASRSDPNVTGVLGPRRTTIVTGTSVHQNETVQTSADGRTTLEFRDSTNLFVGSNASVKLDRYVFNPDSSARAAVINMTKGTFRFVTGASNPGAFTLQTPHATIGIRGTIVEIDVESARTRITLLQGLVNVCPRAGGRRTCEVMTPGQSLTVSRLGLDRVPDGGPNPGRTGPDPGGGSGGANDGGGGGGGRGGR
jgi:hypothetical protein